DVRVQREHLVQEVVVVVVAAVHRPGDLAALPRTVLLRGHLGELAADLGPVEALGGQPVEHAVALGVGVQRTHRDTSVIGDGGRSGCIGRVSAVGGGRRRANGTAV